jgi:hypothetical protein
MVMHPHTKYHWPISKEKNVMAQTRKYYLKNNYLTLRSKVKVPRRSLWYVTHRLMVMQPYTKYNWPIELKQWGSTIPPITTNRTTTSRLKSLIPKKDCNVWLEIRFWLGTGTTMWWKNNYLTLKSKVKVPQRSLRYATHRLMVMHPHTK